MKYKKIVVIIVWGLILFAPIVSFTSDDYTFKMGKKNLIFNLNSSYIVHGIIDINGDSELNAFENITDGDGTQTDPYIIENLIIDAGGVNDVSAIEIRSTTKHLIIRNCVLTNSGRWWKDSGIYLQSTRNITIQNCKMYDCINGVMLYTTINCTVKGCDSYSNEDGIQIYQSDKNLIQNNTLRQNTIGLDFSGASDDWNIVEWNNISYNTDVGISYFGHNNPNWVRYNHIANNSDYGINMADSSQIIYKNNITGNNNGGIYLLSGTNNSISFNNISYNIVDEYGGGIEISGYGTSYNKIFNNNIYGHKHYTNKASGIRLSSNAFNNNITANTINNNNFGIFDYLANNTIIQDNNISKCITGIYVEESDNVTIDGNYIFKSSSDAISLNGLYYSEFSVYTRVSNIKIINNIILNTSRYAVYLNSASFTFDHHFNITNNIIANNSNTPIYLTRCTTVTIKSNRIHNNGGTGIYGYYMASSLIDNNSLTDNSGHGIHITNLDNHKIKNNTIIKTKTANNYGILIQTNVDSVNITKNYIDNFNYGISINSGQNHNVTDNIVVNCVSYGIYISSSGLSSIYHNHLQYNYHNFGEGSQVNLWDNGTQGNYWDDYLERYPLAGNDGTVYDTPYQIRAGITQDNYPLVNGFWASPMPSSTTLTNQSGYHASQVLRIQWNRALYALYYRVYVNDVLNCSTNETYVNLDFKSNGTFTVSISVNNSVGETEKSPSITLHINIPPDAPTFTSPVSPCVQINNPYFDIYWTAVPGATSYNIYCDLEYRESVIYTFFNDFWVPEGQHNITVTAVRVGIESVHSNILNITYYDAPDNPYILSDSPMNVYTSDVELYVWWYGGTHGHVYVNGEFHSEIAQETFPIVQFTSSGTYTLFIRAANDNNIESVNSNIITINVYIGTPPAQPIFVTQSQTIDATTFIISWNVVNGATSYKIYVNNVLNGTTSNTNFEIDFKTEGLYNIKLVAHNNSGDSTPSDIIEITVDITTGNGDPNGIPPWIYALLLIPVGALAGIVLLKKNRKFRDLELNEVEKPVTMQEPPVPSEEMPKDNESQESINKP